MALLKKEYFPNNYNLDKVNLELKKKNINAKLLIIDNQFLLNLDCFYIPLKIEKTKLIINKNDDIFINNEIKEISDFSNKKLNNINKKLKLDYDKIKQILLELNTNQINNLFYVNYNFNGYENESKIFKMINKQTSLNLNTEEYDITQLSNGDFFGGEHLTVGFDINKDGNNYLSFHFNGEVSDKFSDNKKEFYKINCFDINNFKVSKELINGLNRFIIEFNKLIDEEKTNE